MRIVGYLGVCCAWLLAACSFSGGEPGVADASGSGDASTGSVTTSFGTSNGTSAGSASASGGSTGTASPTSSGATTSGGTGSSSGGSGSSSGGQGDCDPLIIQVLAEITGSDGDQQWVQLYNPCPERIDLSGYSLGWGGTDYGYGTFDLSMSFGPGECLLVGGTQSNPANGNPVFDITVNLQPQLEDGSSNAVGLFLAPGSSLGPGSIPVDALIYGNDNSAGFLDPAGVASPPVIGAQGNNVSMRRTSQGPTWEAADPSTPNVCPSL